MFVPTWHPPASGWLKLNTDGSSRGNPGESSFRGVIRDDDGCWVCGYAGKLGDDTSLGAEIWGISIGLNLIRAKKLRNVIIETDCQATLMLISAGEVDDSHHQSWLIKACKRDLVELGCYMVHVRRNANNCADHVATVGGTQGDNFVIYDDPPLKLMSLLEEDVRGFLRY